MPKVSQAEQNVSSSIAGVAELFSDAQKVVMDVQAELLEQLKEAGEHWAALAQAEARVGAEWFSKLPTLRTLPQAAEAIQQLATQQAAIAAEDGKKILEDCQKCMALTTKIMSVPWPQRAGGGT
jgi:hypothetical protein